ncbi:Hydrogenase maturation protease [Candidatus Terasakiella magnetica]|uniref:Hydrogenase maturation protease n=1 Tax=Candidatus Terasakiella magnetica TaxID=1867952 RepID=A0A1C3RLX6_9PROT|nr:hydrogenase maturation protease [Candidatus Terasakiella magnetica]SCA58256.1 Hydrogenase maturation protease [Candidatus Terasakiella magnetica]
MHKNAHTHIICFGNPLHGDDGFGTAVFKALSQQDLGTDVKLMDGGTSSLSALNLFEGCEQAIVVDALKDDTGTVGLSWHSAEHFKAQTHAGEISSHGLGVGAILQGLDILAEDQKVVEDIKVLTCTVASPKTFKMELSAEVGAKVDEAVGLILDHVSQGGSL